MPRPVGLVPKFEICVSDAAEAWFAVCRLTPSATPTATARPAKRVIRDRVRDMGPLRPRAAVSADDVPAPIPRLTDVRASRSQGQQSRPAVRSTRSGPSPQPADSLPPGATLKVG